MGKAKDIILRPISSADARRVIKALHYSGKVVQNSQIHLGAFLNGRCGGAMQFGPSLDKRKIMGLVRGTRWNEFIELNRLAFADWLPRNGESRCLGYAMRWLRQQYPWLRWVISFADGAQCGDGTIYRASGFVLTGIKKNNQIYEAPTGKIFSRMSLTDQGSCGQKKLANNIIIRTSRTKGKHILTTGAASMKQYIEAGFKPKKGHQLRYIYFLDLTAQENLTVPILPFSEIERRGAGMYRGKFKGAGVSSVDSDAIGDQPKEGGANPTDTLHLANNSEL